MGTGPVAGTRTTTTGAAGPGSRTGTAASTSSRRTRRRALLTRPERLVRTARRGGGACPRLARSSRLPQGGAEVKTILVVEDEMKIARLVRDYLEQAGFDVIVTGDGNAALASARGTKPDLVVLDLGLPGRDGLDVTRELR